MVAIQILLIAGIGFLLIWFFKSPSSSKMRAWKKIFGVLFTIVAVGLVLFPQSANDAAHAVGVGRGADLLLYLLTLAFIFGTLNQYVKSKQDEQRIVELGRQITLLEARLPQAKRSSSKQ